MTPRAKRFLLGWAAMFVALPACIAVLVLLAAAVAWGVTHAPLAMGAIAWLGLSFIVNVMIENNRE